MSDLYATVKKQEMRIQELEDTVVKMKKMYDDILSNLDDSNFSSGILKEKGNMKAKLKVTSDEISTAVEKINGTEKYVSEIKQTADKIESTVSVLNDGVAEMDTRITQTADRIETVAEDVSDVDNRLSSEITQTANCITSSVKREFSKPYQTSNFSELIERDTDKTYFDTSLKLYYYYDDITKEWYSTEKAGIESVFEQTDDGFMLRGNVKIDGGLITDGTISADRIDVDNLRISKLYQNRSLTGGYFAMINSSYGDFGVYSPSATDDDNVTSTKCVFGAYRIDPAYRGVNFYASGDNFLGYGKGENDDNYKSFPKGTWDFSSADEVDFTDANVKGLSVIAVFG